MSSNLPQVAKQQVGIVESRVKELQEAGQIELPPDYSVSNALRSAFLTLQETKTKDQKPALEVCTQASITNAMLDMVVQGLTPARKQIYFIAYGQQLVCQPSYFGDMAIAKRVDPRVADIVAEVVHKGDEFEFELEQGRKRVTKHKQTLDSLNGKIKGAYAIVLGHQGEELSTVVMSWDEILKSWEKSPVKPVQNGDIKGGTTHANHPVEMAKRTVIRKVCKPIINSASDRYIQAAYNRGSQIQSEAEVEVEETENANQDVIDVPPTEEPQEATEGPGTTSPSGESPPDEAVDGPEPDMAAASEEPGF